MSAHTDFLNKNMNRKYPIRSDMPCLCEDGSYLPQELITSMQLTTDYTNRELYISKVFTAAGYISVTISSNASGLVLGCFSAAVKSNFETIPLTPSTLQYNISGSMTIGTLKSLETYQGARNLTFSNARIEDSLIFIFTPPGITNISKKLPDIVDLEVFPIISEQALTGHITLLGDNVAISEQTPNITLSVINTASIKSLTDIGGKVNNCSTPIITHLNTVTPDVNGNIDIYGILPLKINIESGTLDFADTALTLDEVCPERKKLAPPENNSNNYYTDILATRTPEWKDSWPEFNP